MKTEVSLLHFWLWGCNSSWFLPCGHMVNKEYYLKVMKMPRGTLRRKRSDLWRGKNSCSIMTSGTFIPSDSRFSHKTWDDAQPPASTFARPCTKLTSFTKLKSILEGLWFESTKEIKENLLAELHSIPRQAFQEYFQNWNKCWEWCIQSGEEYFQWDNAQ
jgi:hypothetical protein